METVLWVLQITLAAIFLVTGLIKLTQPRRKLAAGPMSWAAEVTDTQFRMIGAAEVLAAAGLVLPAALGIAPILTAFAAAGVLLTMVGATIAHVRMREAERIVVPLALFVVALYVAIERFSMT